MFYLIAFILALICIFLAGMFYGLYLGTFDKNKKLGPYPNDVTGFVGDEEVKKTVKGNQKAVIMDDFTDKEAEEYEMMVNRGWRKFYNKLKHLFS